MNISKLFQSGSTKAAGIFKKTSTAAKMTFNNSTIKNDVLLRGARGAGQLGSNIGNWIGGRFTSISSNVSSTALGRTLGQGARNIAKNRAVKLTGKFGATIGRGTARIGKAMAMPSLITVGAVGMLGVSIMNGANNAAKDIIFERYMSDQRFSRDMLLQSRLGTAMGTGKMNKYGSTVGLSNSLSRTRHGASY